MKPSSSEIFSDAVFSVQILDGHKTAYLTSGILVIVSGASLAISPYILGQLVNHLADSAFAEGQHTPLLLLLSLYVGSLILSVLFSSVSDYMVASRSEDISHELRKKIMERVFEGHADSLRESKAGKGKIISLISRDVDVVWDFFGFAITEMLTSLVVIIAMCAVAIYLHTALGVFLALYSTVFVFLFYVNGKGIKDIFSNVSPLVDGMLNFVDSSLSGFETIKAFRAQSWARGKIERLSKESSRLASKAHYRHTTFAFCSGTANALLGLLLWLICLPGIFRPEPIVAVSIGGLVSMQFYLSMITRPLETISSSAKVFSKSMVSVRRLKEFLGATSEKDTHETHLGAPPYPADTDSLDNGDAIRLDNVSLVKTNREGCRSEVLNGINMKIAMGSIVGLAGESGGGKTSLLRVMARMERPTSGNIKLIGVDADAYTEDEYRKTVTYLNQQVAIFPSTLEENVLLGRPSMKDKEDTGLVVRESLNRASFIDAFSRYGSSGNLADAGMSGGEAQRVSISRVHSRWSSVYLLDEPTSALDFSNSANVIENMVKLRTSTSAVVVASHSPSLLSRCDRVILLQHGRIVAQGEHDHLLKSSELYRNVTRETNDDHT